MEVEEEEEEEEEEEGEEEEGRKKAARSTKQSFSALEARIGRTSLPKHPQLEACLRESQFSR